MFFFYRAGDNRSLHVLTHPSPTRRSSDLWPGRATPARARAASRLGKDPAKIAPCTCVPPAWLLLFWLAPRIARPVPHGGDKVDVIQQFRVVGAACDAVRRPAVRHGAGGTFGSSAGAAGRGYAPDGSWEEPRNSASASSRPV